jgi:hypothetical protein
MWVFWMAIEVTTIGRLIWNTWPHTGIFCMIREGECRECALDAGHVLADPSLQISPEGVVPTSEGSAADEKPNQVLFQRY